MMSGGGSMSGGGMMGGGNAMAAVSVAMAHSSMSGMMGGGAMSSGGSSGSAQPTVAPQSMAGMMGGGRMMGGNAAAQLFTSNQVSSVASGMGINMMMGGGMMGGGMQSALMSFDYGDTFNRQDIKEMRAQGFNAMQINRFINKNDLDESRAGSRFQTRFQNMQAKKSNAYQQLQSQFNDLQTRFDELSSSSSNSTTNNYDSSDYGFEDYSYEEPYYEEPMMEEPAQSGGSEQNNPFGNSSGTNISVGGGFGGFTGTGTGTATLTGGGSNDTGTGTTGQTGDLVSVQEGIGHYGIHPPIGTMGGTGGGQSTNTTTGTQGGSTTNPSNFTGYQPFTLQNYTPLGTSVATNQQIYTSQGGQGFYGSPQVTPTNPFTGAAYDLDENGLPQYNLTYGGGATLPGQVLPVQQGQKAAKKKQGGSPLRGL